MFKDAGKCVVLIGAALGVAIGAGFAEIAPAAAQNLVLGKQTYQAKVNCPECHGWAGHGDPEDPRAPRGANLRDSKLNKEALITIIQCGRPGASMPYFDVRAYEDDRCYGMTKAQIGDQMPPPGTPNLIAREIEAVADYLLAKVIGRGPITREECAEYFGGEVNRCRDFPPRR